MSRSFLSSSSICVSFSLKQLSLKSFWPVDSLLFGFFISSAEGGLHLILMLIIKIINEFILLFFLIH